MSSRLFGLDTEFDLLKFLDALPENIFHLQLYALAF